ncbi:MAG: TonB-dependent receptor [Bacteroidota bacterium]
MQLTLHERLPFLLAFLFFCSSTLAQSYGKIAGQVLDSQKKALPFASIAVVGTTLGVSASEEGDFVLDRVPVGEHKVQVQMLGYESKTQMVVVKKDQVARIDFVLEEQNTLLNEVEIAAKSEASIKKESGYSVDVLESKQYQNLTTDINQILQTTSGINLRESGGLGSGFSLSLNGLSGNQVRYFIDGVPMENFGSALTLNNFPINLVENIEVYKGVVPIHLGADALGGAINIIPSTRYASYLDASYSGGSFNTHRASINGRHANEEKGWFVQGYAFFNHSDNNYTVDSVKVWDLELGNFLGFTSAERFHDQYTSGMANVQFGIREKAIADEWTIGVTGARNRKNYQHPDNNILRVFGNFHTREETYLLASSYKKKIGRLSIKANTTLGKIEESIIDTSTLKYNWAGDFIRRSENDPKGELYERRSLFTLDDGVWRSNIGGSYQLAAQHQVSLNFNHSHLRRSGEDEVDALNRSFTTPNSIQKYVLGADYTFQTKDDRFTSSLFGKSYWFGGKIVTQDFEGKNLVTKPQFQNFGYGVASRWRVFEGILTKVSFERAYRLPEPFEILGDGIYININPSLQPEQSYNFNAGLNGKLNLQNWQIQAESNYFLRSSSDFIRFLPLGPFGEFENLTNVKSKGVEGSLNIEYKQLILFSGNVTYQNITDQNEFDEGLENINYQSRIPNIPYFFANARLGVQPINTIDHRFGIFWSTNFTEAFFLNWERLGSASTKNIIPRQLTHQLDLEYAFQDGRYNLSASVFNLTDAKVFDNFSIQLPGRAVYLKLRYFIY